jgi:hypothetical protein
MLLKFHQNKYSFLSFHQFVETGCENCDFLSMENSSVRVLEVVGTLTLSLCDDDRCFKSEKQFLHLD